MMPKCYVCWKSNMFNLSILVLEITLLLLLLNWGICRSQWLPSLSVYDDDNVDKTIVKIYAIQTQPYHANKFTCKHTHKCTKSHTFKKKSACTSLLCICGSSNTCVYTHGLAWHINIYQCKHTHICMHIRLPTIYLHHFIKHSLIIQYAFIHHNFRRVSSYPWCTNCKKCTKGNGKQLRHEYLHTQFHERTDKNYTHSDARVRTLFRDSQI